MKLSRRDFLKLTGVALGTVTLANFGFFDSAEAAGVPVQYAKEVTTICPYCSVGCGIICYVQNNKVVGAEGDPDHPINEGSLCSKGSSVFNLSYVYNQQGEAVENPKRVKKVLYRAKRATEWQEVDWDWAITEIAKRIKETRDSTFERVDENGVTVNRTRAIAHLGSATCTNEENYLYQKMIRALGIINIDHCARL